MGGMTSFRSRAKRRMDCAIKCSESDSNAEARARARSVVPAIRSDHIHYAELTLCERAGFIEDDDVNLTRGFERQTIADEDAVLCAHGCGDGNDQRNGQTERVRTGDDQHGNDAIENFDVEGVGNGPGDGGEDGSRQARCKRANLRLYRQAPAFWILIAGPVQRDA
jgi:hypothetical protein